MGVDAGACQDGQVFPGSAGEFFHAFDPFQAGGGLPGSEDCVHSQAARLIQSFKGIFAHVESPVQGHGHAAGPIYNRFICSAFREPSGSRLPMTTPSARRPESLKFPRRSDLPPEKNRGNLRNGDGSGRGCGYPPCGGFARTGRGVGVVPPMTRLAHSSRRSAPPSFAQMADCVESTQHSRVYLFSIGTSLKSYFYCNGW